ncbi:tyrosine-type recombinase/integrase [Azospirillum sp. sgz302134]
MAGHRKLPFPPRPVADWPEGDRVRWQAARTADDILDEPGSAAHWRASTAAHTALCYGYWLAWLASEGALDATAPPHERVTRDRVRAYIGVLQRHLAPTSVATVVTRLHEAVRVLCRNADLHWLRTAASRLHTASEPVRDKLARIIDSDRLFETGLAMMATAETAAICNPRTRALRHRDGLLMAFLAARPLRLTNLAAITLGQHLIMDGETVSLRFPGEEMKNGRPLEVSWPSALLEPLRTHLAVHRPMLVPPEQPACLWVGRLGPLSRIGCQHAIMAATKRELGTAIPPHFFRYAAATTVAFHAPEDALIIAAILGHTTLRTSERYYNQATALQATRRHQELVKRLRKEGRSKKKETTS